RMTSKARRLIGELFALLSADPALLPPDWGKRAAAGKTAVTVGDYIAGMTDRFALEEHRRLTDLSVPG
ncbi:MAG TPA: deoxyguanosinetriphosphate triphosphohydrolase, partial [Acetobacteraceae bacterium]|nr:deoxyguanosinetriphosphate triphosphohydrolase [Acetobacteraceae bacterium]